MIKSFACRDTEKLFNDQRALRFQAFERQARKRLMVLHAAPSIEALMLNPGNKFHALSGDRKRYFGVEAQFWLNLQTEYNLRMMKRKIWADIERRIIPIKDTGNSLQHSANSGTY